MDSITNTTTRLARAIGVGAALATLTVGFVAAGVPTASAASGALTQRSQGSDDPPGDDNGGRTGGSDDPAGDDNGGTRSGGGDDGGGDDGGGDGNRVIRTGSCSGSADWKLKVKTDDGRLEVEGEIDSNVAGQQWRWTLRHNGSVTDRGTGTTTARSGSFDVERRMVNLAGTDVVSFRAVRDGQVCRGVVNY